MGQLDLTQIKSFIFSAHNSMCRRKNHTSHEMKCMIFKWFSTDFFYVCQVGELKAKKKHSSKFKNL